MTQRLEVSRRTGQAIREARQGRWSRFLRGACIGALVGAIVGDQAFDQWLFFGIIGWSVSLIVVGHLEVRRTLVNLPLGSKGHL